MRVLCVLVLAIVGTTLALHLPSQYAFDSWPADPPPSIFNASTKFSAVAAGTTGSLFYN